MKLVVGLGNPGDKYKHTRHNAGFLALDFFLKEIQTIHCQSSFNAQVCEVHFHAKKTGTTPLKVFFIKPQTYMNNSGKAVKAMCDFYKINPEANLLVVHDEIDLLLGNYKATNSSRSAGHNGVQDIIDTLGSQDFQRIRVGIEARKQGDKTPTHDYVLSPFSAEELKLLETSVFPETSKLIDQFLNQ